MCRSHTRYLAMLNQSETSNLCIVDSGADSHVGGSAWLPITATNGPLVKYANVVGFDAKDTMKKGLPIVSDITKCITKTGDPCFIRAKHMVLNHTSPHTLLSTYHMRNLGIIVDDVSKRHLKSIEQHSTSSIQSSNSNTLNLEPRGVLQTFQDY